MHPVLFRLGPIRVDAYYVIWSIALALMVLWTRRRAVARYNISYNDATDVLIWTMIGVFAGATIGGYLDHWTRYAEDPIRILYFWESGLSSGPGFIGGGLAGLYKLHKLSVSTDSFADAAAIPCAFMIAVGRWGCFLNGCCRGIETTSSISVVFPQTPNMRVYPSQLFESFAGLLIGLFLILIERWLDRKGEDTSKGAVIFPQFLILYGLYRYSYDFLREGDRIFGFRVGQYAGMIAVAVGLFWIARSIRKIRGPRHCKQ